VPKASASHAPSVHNHNRVSRARLFIRALGISFVSVLSVLVALYAFIEMPQVQDLLLDARPYWVQEVIYWTAFYAIGVFIWAWPLAFSARLLLLQNFERIGVDTEARFRFYIFVLPGIYVRTAFVSIILGIMAAGSNLPVAMDGNKYESILRKFVEVHLITLVVATVIVLVLTRGLFLRSYRLWLNHLERTNPQRVKNALINIERLTGRSTHDLEGLDVHLTALKPGFLSTETWIEAQRVKAAMWLYMSGLMWLLLLLIAIHFLSYSDLIRGNITMSGLPSSLQSAWDFIAESVSLKRAAFLFVLFGAWLPFLAIIALFSNCHQFPYLTTLIIIGLGLTLFIGDGHDMRVAALSKEQQKTLRPVAFAEALQDWKAASGWNAKGCEQLPANAPELSSCPRPIIVAGEGGGSRAAFLLASVLGAIEDDSLDKQKNPTAHPFHQQLFAISSVSGSSVGSAFFVSALKAQPNAPSDKLKEALHRQRQWFRNVAAANPDGASRAESDFEGMSNTTRAGLVTYKDTLQAVLSNDFISPVLIGYLARDIPMLSRIPFILDRAGILETAWEDAFNDVYGTSRKSSPLSGPLQAMGPSPESWMPLIFMNATSTETGRRVIVSPVKITEPAGTGNSALFADAYGLYELLCSPYRDPVTHSYPELSPLDAVARIVPEEFSPVAQAKCVDKKPVSIDIRLSTAASVSSRSPFVTPHAHIRDRRGQIADSVVDGGFFDNSGIVTALEVAQGVKALDGRLLPFILQVSSEPSWFETSKNCSAGGTYSARPQIPDQADFRPLGALTDLLTVNSTRISRGYETILELPRRAKELNGGIPSAAQIHVCPQPEESFFWNLLLKYTSSTEKNEEKAMRILQKAQRQAQYKSISLSWWLSPPLQAYLDGQLYTKHNMDERNCVVSLLKDARPKELQACH
jgi:hypothetical protein